MLKNALNGEIAKGLNL